MSMILFVLNVERKFNDDFSLFFKSTLRNSVLFFFQMTSVGSGSMDFEEEAKKAREYYMCM